MRPFWYPAFWSASSIRPAVSPIRRISWRFERVAATCAHSVKSACFSEPPAIRIIGSSNERIAAIDVSGVVENESLMKRMPFFSAINSSRWGRPLNVLVVSMMCFSSTPRSWAARAAGSTFSRLCLPSSATSVFGINFCGKKPVFRMRSFL